VEELSEGGLRRDPVVEPTHFVGSVGASNSPKGGKTVAVGLDESVVDALVIPLLVK
jgi:hypothetical protein